jgi:hypothetical protein
MAVGRSSVATMDRNAMPEDTREHHVTLSIKEAPYLAGSSQPRWQGRIVTCQHETRRGRGKQR